MPLIPTLISFGPGNTIVSADVNSNLTAIRDVVNNNGVLTDVAKVITASHTFPPGTLVGAGAGTAILKPAGVVSVQTSSTGIGNVGAGEDVLMAYTLPANSLDSNGRAIRVRAFGNTAANANSKIIRIKYGVLGFQLYNSTQSGADTWYCDLTIIRNAHLVHLMTHTTTDTLAVVSKSGLIANSYDETTPGDIAVTGEAVTNNDVLCFGLLIEFLN